MPSIADAVSAIGPDHNIRVGGNRTCASLRSGPAHRTGRGVHTTHGQLESLHAHIAFPPAPEVQPDLPGAPPSLEPRGVPRLVSERGPPLVGSRAIKRAPWPHQQGVPETGHHARHSQRQRFATCTLVIPQPAAIDRIVCAHRPVGLMMKTRSPAAQTAREATRPGYCSRQISLLLSNTTNSLFEVTTR